MIRLRSQKLLSGVSTLAVLAAFGAVDPVLADTISGPGNVPAINTDDLADLGPVTIDTNANVGVDGSGRSFYNPGTNTLAGGGATALVIGDSVLQGSIVNDGVFTSTDDGLNVSDSIINGGLTNNGTIDVDGDGVDISSSIFAGGINNAGTIIAGSTGIYLNDDGTFTGGILNSGLIEAASYGIYVEDDWSFAGGINNALTGTITAGNTAIYIDADSFTGGITNAGLIQATSSDIAIYLEGDSFAGGINNSGTIVSDTSNTAIYVNNGVFAGGITNSGLISSPSYYGIFVAADLFQGGINNSGTIASDNTGITTDGDIFQGGITNSGLIESTNDAAIYVSSGTFQGGINNSGTLSGYTTTLYISNVLFEGGVTNSGLITSTNTSRAVYISNTTFRGGLNNTSTGVINADSVTALYIGSTSFDGGVTNAGTIVSGSGYGINTANTTFNGGINNSGLVQGGTDDTAVYLDDTTFNGGVTNSGVIASGTANGYGIRVATDTFTGGINNSGTIAADYTAIYFESGTFAGGITNSGLVTSADNYGIYLDGDSFAGGINNTSTGSIVGDSYGIYIDTPTFEGGITNAGLITANGSTGIYISSSNDTFAGGINNTATGTILGSDGIDITNTTFTGGITNAGLIATTNTEHGINISNTTFTGGIQNSGTIIGDTAIQISTTTFEGGIVNSGRLEGTSTYGIDIDATNFSGGFSNTGVITAESTAVTIDVTNWNGDFTNSGTIETFGSTGTGVELDATNFNGNFVNSGVILGGTTTGDGVNLSGSLFDGNVTNSGTIVSNSGVGLSLNHSLYTGNVANSGTILAVTTGIYISDVVAGTLTNSGLIDPSYGIIVDGEVQGGIFNSGTILATVTAIDLSSTTADHEITQTGGLIQGNSLADGTGTVEVALDLANTYEDTFNGNGGVLDGDVVGGAADGDDFAVGGNFVYLRGTATDIDQLDFNSGRGAFGVRDANGDGLDDDDTGLPIVSNNLTFNALDMNVNAGGTAYLGENTQINVADDLTVDADGTLAYLVTTAPGAGQVAAGDDANLDGTLLAVLDPIDFASATSDTYTYNNIITGQVFNTFSDVTTSSLFWTATADYNAGDVDLEINRIDFGDVLSQLGLIQTQNQQAVGDTLEEIFQDIQVNGPTGNEFDELFAALFGTTDPALILAMYDEINGSEHAQVQQTILTASQLFNTIVGEQLDRTLLTLDGARFANMGTQRYASAAAIMANDASAASVGGSNGLNRGKSGVSVWARGFGQWTNTDTDPEASGYDQDSTGLAGGVDVALGSNATLGGAVVYSNTDVEFDSPGDDAEFDSWQVGLYGNYGFGNFYAAGSGSYAWHDVSTVRTIQLPVPGAPFTALAGYDASAWSVAGEVGGIWPLGRVNVQPSVGLAYTGADTDGFTETGNAGAYTLDVSSTDADSFAGILALRASGLWTMGQTRVVPDIKVGWRHEFNDDRQTFTALYLGDPTETPFTIVSSEVQQDAALVSAGVTFGLTNNLEIFGDVNGLYNSDSSSTNASGGVRLTW